METRRAIIAWTAVLLIAAAAFVAIRIITAGDRGLDPRFDTCAEAQAHKYGPYISGEDSEYGWYDDRNHDGVVCE
jgi:hypothetical protein